MKREKKRKRKKKKRRRGREDQEVWMLDFGMELWILYGSHGIVRLYMIKCLSPNLGF